jgi:hypothetical protein
MAPRLHFLGRAALEANQAIGSEMYAKVVDWCVRVTYSIASPSIAMSDFSETLKVPYAQ